MGWFILGSLAVLFFLASRQETAAPSVSPVAQQNTNKVIPFIGTSSVQPGVGSAPRDIPLPLGIVQNQNPGSLAEHTQIMQIADTVTPAFIGPAVTSPQTAALQTLATAVPIQAVQQNISAPAIGQFPANSSQWANISLGNNQWLWRSNDGTVTFISDVSGRRIA